MTTLAEFRVLAARKLDDPDGQTFDADMLDDVIIDAITEVGVLAPELFKEDITPVDGTLEYPLRSDVFAQPVPEISLSRVEWWDGSVVPAKFRASLQAGENQPLNQTDSGWRVWNGTLELTNLMASGIDSSTDFIRVWGYSPYVIPADDNTVLTLSPQLERAALTCVRLFGLELLNASRDLFTQWQTRSGNSDISPAGLLNALSLAQAAWRSKSRMLARARESAT